jgi:thiol-disulfide isomerase/thioredoxin
MRDEQAMMDAAREEGAEEGAPAAENENDGTGAAAREGSYEPYAPEKLAMAADGDVVLFFRASWCPTCRALDANIRSNLGGIPDGVTILDVDYDTATELKQKYGVTYQHTLVQVDAEGNMIARWTGSPTLATLLAQVQ